MNDALDQHLIAGWLSAAEELGIRVVAPYSLASQGAAVLCEVFLPDFGSPTGALFVSASTERRLRSELEAADLWTAIELDGPEVAYDVRTTSLLLRTSDGLARPTTGRAG